MKQFDPELSPLLVSMVNRPAEPIENYLVWDSLLREPEPSAAEIAFMLRDEDDAV